MMIWRPPAKEFRERPRQDSETRMWNSITDFLSAKRQFVDLAQEYPQPREWILPIVSEPGLNIAQAV